LQILLINQLSKL